MQSIPASEVLLLEQESGKVMEENSTLRHQLADIQTSLQQLTHSNEATLQDVKVSNFDAVPISVCFWLVWLSLQL